MVLTKEQKQELLDRLQEGKKKKALEKAQIEKELKELELKKKEPAPVPVPSPELKEPPAPVPVIPFEEPLPEPMRENTAAYYTKKETIANESKKNKYYNKETGQPLMKIKLYREPENDAIIHNLLNSLQQNKRTEPKEEVKPAPKPQAKPVKSKEDERKEYIKKLSENFF